jgi:uridine phosphorylase
MEYGMDYGSMGKIGSSDDFFDEIESEERLQRVAFGANRLTERFNNVISKEFLEIDLESLLTINLCSVNMLCSSCMLISEEKRDDYFNETIKSLKSLFLEYKKIPPSKH